MNDHQPLPNDIMGSSTSKSQKPPASQTEMQSSVPAAGLSPEPSAQCNLVLNDANLLTMILIITASTGPHRSHKVFMMEACDTTIGEIALQKRDELWACIRQVCCPALQMPVGEKNVVATGNTAAVQRWQGP